MVVGEGGGGGYMSVITSSAFLYKAMASSIRPCSLLMLARLLRESACKGFILRAVL